MKNQEYVAGLRALADWYEANPDMPLPNPNAQVFNVSDIADDQKKAAQLIMKAAAPCKKIYADKLFHITKEFGPVELEFIFLREKVCERVVIAKEEVPERLIPAQPERVEPAYVREIVEWRCEPILPSRQSA